MNRNSRQHAEELNIKRNRRTRRQRILSVLASITVFCTTYALIIPALTIENDQLNKAQYMLASEDVEITTGGAITVAETEDAVMEEIAEEPAEEIAEAAEGEELAEEIAAAEETEIRAMAEDGAEVVITGVLPEDAEATIFPVTFNDEELVAYFGEELAASMKGFVAYDITIWSNGEEWQPDESVNVQVLQPAIELAEEDTLTAVHFEETEEETTLIEVAANVTADGAIEFPAEGFSVYAFYVVTKTVDGDQVTLEAVTEDGLVITVKGSIEALPYPEEELRVSVTDLSALEGSEGEEDAEDLAFLEEQKAILEENEIGVEGLRFLDITLWHNDEQIEPDDTVTVSVSGMIVVEEQLPEIMHITEEGEVEFMEVELTDDGVSFETDGFSTYVMGEVNRAYVTVGEQDVMIKSAYTGEAYNESWTSSNTNAATVAAVTSKNASITAKGSGNATITHTYYKDRSKDRYDRDYTYSNKVTETIEIVVVKESREVYSGSTASFSRSETYSNQWTIESGASIASIASGSNSSSVTLNANAAGTVLLKNTYKNSRTGSSHTEYYLLKVLPTINHTHDITLPVGSTYPLENSGLGSVSSGSGNAAYFNGSEIVAQAEGSITITQTYEADGNHYKVVYNVTVTPVRNLTKKVRIIAGDTYKDSNAAVGGTWTSKNSDIVTVKDGVFTGVKPGEGEITHTYYVNENGIKVPVTYTYYVTVASSADVDYTDSVFFSIHKQIDYLGDNTDVDNPDTDNDGKEDEYRLYLDMTGKEEPVDLVLVVDVSGSMHDNTVDGSSTSTGTRRDDALTTFLNGSTSSVTGGGFISWFLNQNPENKVSVVQFGGKKPDKNTFVSAPHTTDSDTSIRDSYCALDWRTASTYNNSFVNCKVDSSKSIGTNYEAGLQMATAKLAENSVKNDNHKKVMIFISDGVPTMYMLDERDIGKEYKDASNTTQTIDESDINAGRTRWGNGNDGGSTGDNGEINYPQCVAPTKEAVDDFMAANPGTLIYSIGVSSFKTGTGNANPEVLQYMAEQGNGLFFKISDNINTLYEALKTVFYPKGVTISDTLSKYVELTSDPDILVTMTPVNGGDAIVLYNGTTVTDPEILSGIDFASGDTSDNPINSTGTISAIFNPDYSLDPDYTYTLSFNVKLTNTAITDYLEKGYEVKGDTNTDHKINSTNNSTSSNQPGLYSNDSAVVSYTAAGEEVDQVYPRPVVQVQAARVALRKVVDNVNTFGSFEFKVIYAPADSSDIPEGFSAVSAEDIAAYGLDETKNYITGTVTLGHYTGVDTQGEFLVKIGTEFIVEENTADYHTSYRIDDGMFANGNECEITASGSNVIWFKNTPTDSTFIRVQKTFVGISANQIPAGFMITLKSGDYTYGLTMDGANGTYEAEEPKTVGADTVVTWIIPGEDIGEYDISESNYQVSGFAFESTGFGEEIAANGAGTVAEISSYDNTVAESKVYVARTDMGIGVISESALSSNQKSLLTSYIKDTKGWSNTDVFFFTVADVNAEKVELNGAKLVYNSSTKKVSATTTNANRITGTMGLNITQAQTPEITLTNTYTACYELPSTGGIGTTIFYVVGGILLVGAVVLLVTKKRMESEDEDK